MRILCVIPARAGSRRIPGKNVRLLAGKPLISWTLDVSQDLASVCDVMVSTDSAEIAALARSCALVPWLRPPDLATDIATSVDVCLHALDWYEQAHGPVDGLLLLQPTSPFRRRASIIRGIDLFSEGCRTVVGVSPAPTHPYWCMRIEGGRLRPFFQTHGQSLRSQDLPPAFSINGSFYLVSAARLRAARSFVDEEAIPLVIDDPAESLDIDTPWDWFVAEAVAAHRPVETVANGQA